MIKNIMRSIFTLIPWIAVNRSGFGVTNYMLNKLSKTINFPQNEGISVSPQRGENNYPPFVK